MKILFIGDVFGKVGRNLLIKYLPQLQKKHNIDFTIVNGENITHGKSINRAHYEFLKNLKIDVITSGNHIFGNKDVVNYINEPNCILLKPLNLNPFTPGKGTVVKECKSLKIRVTNLIGRVFMAPADNQYHIFDELIKQDGADIHFVDFHAEATAEKIAFAWNYDGRVTCVVGTHTHVQTSDNRLLPKGTAFITDVGMTGVWDSIIGLDPANVIYKQKTNLPASFIPAQIGRTIFNGVIVTIDDKTTQATSITRISI